MIQEFTGITIEALSACVPKQCVTSEDFSYLLNPREIRKFNKTTGINERRYASQSVTASDLGFQAASDLLTSLQNPDEIKALIFVSQTSDYKIPFTSNILQARLGLNQNILCLDINAGCAGFIQGLGTSYALAQSMNGKVLLIMAETLSKILDSKDKTTATLFGDAASALLIGYNRRNDIKSYFDYYSDGFNHDAIIIPRGGYRNPINSETIATFSNEKLNSELCLNMNGQKVFDFTLREIPKSIEHFLSKVNMSNDQIDYFLMHQSNKFIIDQIRRNLQIPKEKVPVNIHKFGNTSGVSIPLLIVTELKSKIAKPLKIILTGYGSGLSWGNSLIEITPNTIIKKLIEI
ncbi:ketoacyl-ACP synthase III [Schleiferiaceae bacterium]|nr:ketoacyl-ACP synthase III [Schleiferiaceae bacterium]